MKSLELQNQIKEPLIRRRKDHGKTVHTFDAEFGNPGVFIHSHFFLLNT